METPKNEFEIKLERARELIKKHNVDGLLLRRVSSFAWATCGAASYINTASSEGGSSLVITHDNHFLTTTNIEAPRLQKEEALEKQGWNFQISPWYDPTTSLDKVIEGLNLVTDVPYCGSKNIGDEISRLRSNLTELEIGKFRILSVLCAESMAAAVRLVKPGMSEFQIAAFLGEEAQMRGVQPIVNLIATDERIFHYRHPLPTEKKLNKYALLVLSGRKWGLVCSISRLVHFGAIPSSLQTRIEANIQVNAAFIANTFPGRTLGIILQEGIKAYAEVGFPDEWKLHHQGGVAGYEPREYLGKPGSIDKVFIGQAIAWNPSITGSKTEDTILVGENSNETLTRIPGWPEVSVKVPGINREINCPQVLIID